MLKLLLVAIAVAVLAVVLQPDLLQGLGALVTSLASTATSTTNSGAVATGTAPKQEDNAPSSAPDTFLPVEEPETLPVTQEPAAPVERVFYDPTSIGQGAAAQYPVLYRTHVVTGGVPVLDFRKSDLSHADFIESVVLSKTPVLLKHTHARHWDAVAGDDAWTPETLKQKVGEDTVIKNVYRRTDGQNVFGPLWRKGKPLDTQKMLQGRSPYMMGDMLSKHFFDLLTTKRLRRQDAYLYYTGDLNTKSLVRDIQPISDFIMPTGQTPSVNIWAGQKDVTASLHFDTYDNLFTQIYGAKKFYLFSPAQVDRLFNYPFLHPSFGQSQLHLKDGAMRHEDELADFPLQDSEQLPEGLEVVVKPGEVLYIPPMWFHHVRALSPSISVNVWSQGLDQKRYDGMLAVLSKRLDHTLSAPAKAASVRVFLAALLAGCDLEVEEFVDNLVSTRYQHLIDTGQVDISTDLPYAELCGVVDADLTPEAVAGLQELGLESAEQAVQFQPDTLSIWLGDLVETLLIWASNGNGLDMPKVLSHCLTDSVFAE